MLTTLCKRVTSRATLVNGRRGATTIGRRALSSTGHAQPSTADGSQSSSSLSEIQDRRAFFEQVAKNETLRDSLAYSLSFAEDDKHTDLSSNLFVGQPNTFMLRQLANSQDQLRTTKPKNLSIRPFCSGKLPRTLQDALRPSDRAIVITETQAPFKVVDVNKAWEELCGYTYVESEGKTLGSLLKGPETNATAATALLAQLLQGEEAGAVLTNYTKTGRRFRNHVRVGPLMNETSRTVTHFVGVLQEIQG